MTTCGSVIGSNNCMSFIPPLFTQYEVLIYSTDEVECFVHKFFYNSILDSSLLGFSLRTEPLSCIMHINPSVSKLDSQKTCGLNDILKKSAPKLTPVLCKFCNKYFALLAFLLLGNPLLRFQSIRT